MLVQAGWRGRRGLAETFGIPRRRRPAGDSNEGEDNKSPALKYDDDFKCHDVCGNLSAGRLRRRILQAFPPARGAPSG